jgi:phosphoglycerate dehydrogenase-like enzyme
MTQPRDGEGDTVVVVGMIDERVAVVDEAALIRALSAGRIAGAALDVFEQEPVDPANPLLSMDNVIVTPHSLCWTDECFGNTASIGLASIADVCAHRLPQYIVDRDVLAHPRVQAWMRSVA